MAFMSILDLQFNFIAIRMRTTFVMSTTTTTSTANALRENKKDNHSRQLAFKMGKCNFYKKNSDHPVTLKTGQGHRN